LAVKDNALFEVNERIINLNGYGMLKTDYNSLPCEKSLCKCLDW